MSKISGRNKLHSFGDHKKFLSRIKKTLYYGQLPKTERLSLPVTELASELFSEVKTGRSLERLHCNEAAIISHNACISPCSLVLALLYLDRLKACNPEFLYRIGPSELFLVSLMVSSKFLYDDGEEDEVCLSSWAVSGGISAEELINLEAEFLDAIQWNVFVGELSFWKKLNYIETTVAKRQGFSRGWLTYTELNSLLDLIDINAIIQGLLTLTAVLVTAYTAGLLTIIGSMYIVSNIPGNCLKSASYVVPTLQKEVVNQTYSPIEEIKNEIKIATHDTIFVPNFENKDITLETSCNSKKSIGAVDVLKTGIILASIKSVFHSQVDCNRSCFTYNSNENERENTSWDWWTNPAMIWLSKTSKMIEKLDFVPQYNLFKYDSYMDRCIATCKKLGLEAQLHKASTVRIQDQMETSWHMEWTDSITKTLYNYKPFS